MPGLSSENILSLSGSFLKSLFYLIERVLFLHFKKGVENAVVALQLFQTKSIQIFEYIGLCPGSVGFKNRLILCIAENGW